MVTDERLFYLRGESQTFIVRFTCLANGCCVCARAYDDGHSIRRVVSKGAVNREILISFRHYSRRNPLILSPLSLFPNAETLNNRLPRFRGSQDLRSKLCQTSFENFFLAGRRWKDFIRGTNNKLEGRGESSHRHAEHASTFAREKLA